MANNKRRSRLSFFSWPVTIIVMSFMLIHAGAAEAQVTGSGTANNIPKWTGTNTIGNSVMTENSGNVGIPSTVLSAYAPELRISNSNWSSDPNIKLYHANVSGYRIRMGYSTNNLLLFDSTVDDNTFTSRVVFDGSGNVGIGIISPNYPLTVKKDITGDWQMRLNSNSVNLYLGAQWGSSVPAIGTGDANPMTIVTNNLERLRVDSGGNVGIGTTTPGAYKLAIAGTAHVTGDLVVDGNVAAKYQDVAEWVPATGTISAGTVVVLDSEQSNHVVPSSRAYDTRVAGVVSASPGVILGEGGNGKVMVATTGRVKIRVDATAAPIRVGDLLVTSDKEGVAMRSVPLDLGGTPIHRPGTLIGKALEPLDKGVGEILVLLSLQ
jgi:hypothetical protein